MPTITATAFPAQAYVLVEVDWTDQPAVTYAKVIRTNTVTGEEVELRPYIAYDGDNHLLLNCGLGIWWDTEPPLNVALTYRTEAADVPVYLTSNPDFETGVAPWVGSNGVMTQSATFAHQGTFSGLFTPVANIFQAILNDDNVPFTSTAPVTVAAWVLSPQGWNAVQAGATFSYDDGFSEQILTNVEIIDDGEWRLVTVTATPRTTGTILNVFLLIYGSAPATTLFYVDEIGVTQPQPVTITATSTPVTVVSESIWLKSPFHPCLDVEIGLCNPIYDGECDDDTRITYIGSEDENRDANTNRLLPANRKHVIPINRVRRAPESLIRLLAHDCNARDRITAVNEPGDELLWQLPTEYCIPDRYITVDVLNEARFSIDQREPFRIMSMPYATVERPPGPADAPCGIRITDLCDIYTSWGAMTIGGLDYEDLLLGEASHDSPGGDPTGLRVWGVVETEFVDWAAVEAAGARDWAELRDGL